MRVSADSTTGERLFDEARRVMRAREPDLRKYVRLLKSAAGLGHPLAQEHLAAWYLEGLVERRGHVVLPRSPGRAVHLLKKAASTGLDMAQFGLAYCYDIGVGVRKNRREAMRLYRQAARQGMSIAAMNIAVLYRESGDRRGEKRWLQRAVELDDTDAELALARLELGSRCGPDRRRYWKGRLRKIAQTRTPQGEDAAALLRELGE